MLGQLQRAPQVAAGMQASQLKRGGGGSPWRLLAGLLWKQQMVVKGFVQKGHFEFLSARFIHVV